MHFDALVCKLADICPVFKIAGTAIQFVKDNSSSLPVPEKFHGVIEYGPASFCRGLHFLKPRVDRKLITLGVAHNSVTLLLKRYALGSLLYGGNPYVTYIPLHVCDFILMAQASAGYRVTY